MLIRLTSFSALSAQDVIQRKIGERSLSDVKRCISDSVFQRPIIKKATKVEIVQWETGY